MTLSKSQVYFAQSNIQSSMGGLHLILHELKMIYPTLSVLDIPRPLRVVPVLAKNTLFILVCFFTRHYDQTLSCHVRKTKNLYAQGTYTDLT